MYRPDVVVYFRRFLKPGNAEASANFNNLDTGMGRKRHRRSEVPLDQLVRGYSLFHSQVVPTRRNVCNGSIADNPLTPHNGHGANGSGPAPE